MIIFNQKNDHVLIIELDPRKHLHIYVSSFKIGLINSKSLDMSRVNKVDCLQDKDDIAESPMPKRCRPMIQNMDLFSKLEKL